jgi:hypothetical protein
MVIYWSYLALFGKIKEPKSPKGGLYHQTITYLNYWQQANKTSFA